MRFLSTRWRRGAAVVVGVPLVGLGGLSAYVQYRQRTRPARHIFRPLVDAEGNLVLEGKVIPRPNTATVVHRSVELVAIFAPMLILYFLMSWNAALYDRWLRWMVNAVERAGPVFVKIGQWACTREDLFSPKLRSVLKRLYNEVEVHPFPETMKILEEELGCDPYTVFDSIEATTVGSGSIGQVHLARIKNTQDRVVIKVMHPNIIENITVDFCILHRLAKTLDEMFPSLDYYDLKGLSSGFTSHLAAQLDFRIEAENLEQFRANFERTQFVRIPKPIISTQRVLVETFCEGEPANPEYLASLPRHARDVLAGKGLNTWCQMLLRDNFIHGDMHPGNILIDGSDVHEPQVTLIDVGLCQQLTPRESEVTHMLMDGFVRWSSSTVAESLWNMSSHQRFANREKFDAELDEVFTKFRPAKNDQGAVTNVLQAIFECVRENSVQMEPPYVSLLFAVLVLESFIMNLNPEFNMVRHAAPWLVSEGFISKGVIKNWLKTRRDAIVREYGILRGRMGDGMELEKLEGHQNVRMSLV